MSEDSIPLVGVLGSPISHSRSPALHAHWLKRYGIAGHYVPIEVSSDDLPAVLSAMPRMGFVGANVTIPHKEAVVALAHRVSDRADVIGAANTLVFGEGGLINADNTDGYGFTENLRQAIPDWNPSSAPCAVFGAGGASRAVIAALIDLGAPEVRLTNRTFARAEALEEQFGEPVVALPWQDTRHVLDGCGTVVNTTSLGMEGQPPFVLDLSDIVQNAVATDLVYTPLKTPFLEAAAAAGAQTVDGLGMLIHQAVPGFERWFGVRPDADDAAREAVLGA
ncbi:MAG: shikimate dehydrogenase [Rhodobacteraceae bacterium]|nr:shikimate dehydrogenase [Paracoccaceae bacterium]